jgi:AraC-like DNA-binding protein
MNSIILLQELLKCGTSIPIWHYDTAGNLLETNSKHLLLDKILDFIGGIKYMLEYAQNNTRPLVLVSDMGLQWCAVYKTDKEHLESIYLIGPIFSAEISDSFLENSAKQYQIDPTFRKHYINIMKEISVVPGLLFQQYCLMLHYCVNSERLNRSDIQYQPREKIIIPTPTNTSGSFDRLTAYQTELTLLHLLSEGNLQYKQAVSRADHLFNAWYQNTNRSLQSAIIESTGFTTLCIREVISAGISADTAFAVGEGYITSMSQCKNVSELASLNLTMYEDFIFRVRRHHSIPAVSSQIRKCKDYIELHADQELHLSDLSSHVGYSEYYLSRKFKKETGLSISSYHKKIRIERSKLMLVTTNSPIHQIATDLHFASSSHFSETFRKITGQTPQQYRIENQHY